MEKQVKGRELVTHEVASHALRFEVRCPACCLWSAHWQTHLVEQREPDGSWLPLCRNCSHFAYLEMDRMKE